jgi:CRISPR-associated protein Cmr1
VRRGALSAVHSSVAHKKLTGGARDILLKEIVGKILRYSDAKGIYLYGSRARGDFDKTSDIDIAVECVERNGLFAEVLKDEVRTLLELDIVDLSKVSDHLRNEILREGSVIYEKS